MPVARHIFTLQSTSPEETLAVGRTIGAAAEANAVITLTGNLGAGKTWLAKGIAYGLEVPDYEYVNSPAYDLVHEYVGRLKIYHLDLYRLDSLSTDDLFMIQEFYGANGVCLIEWPSRLEPYGYYPAEYLSIDITSPDPDRAYLRELSFSAAGDAHSKLAERLAQKLNV
ncbi:MAG: tRNA (adenosine(37)-N6)-threonylcarbamoyltransferase complex ATPase subunit type 1 TsaE [Anaerolineae bacterium]|nr:tRNA (adenosine(37)-N6)-threonylcarbamoyltransferase complex ATPase subunit type 1 TsaE [Anaerolineae bacterium]